MVKVKTRNNGRETRGTKPTKVSNNDSLGNKLRKEFSRLVKKTSSFRGFIK